ncbi:MAG: bifunctional (p)ppGpp synthetase/guanosine-3',5'-bis(diphosphate) 3'-pyrophosphohydrolase [Clostridia bacterium]|nr:bifunctional (p)ppGpp synthetase/guanosine-3',5'-bis(diphosphate) 3'-pyrophosphohydrolase [Clostridia bacterium]MBR4576595.1 bifunctional (p)ppGpp synthetase/guanosine-3',5'-bis(diphosphate) 3'-pyrophosphohydrolase [Clostridia bacterium]
MPLDQMLNRVQKYHPGDGYQLVERAWKFAEAAHAGQVRKSGEPYFSHPCFVASILTDLMIDPPTIAAGLLHDTVEDCEGITLDTIRSEFGSEVADLVDGVTKLNKLDFANREEAQAESLRKMILAMSRDIRVVLIKLADRLHNMRTLRYQPEDRRVAISRETLDIYAPLAHRLGVYALKQELEDLSLKYIDPDGYNRIVHLVGMKRAEREESIRLVINELTERLDAQHIHYDIDGRSKHFYSIYRKMVLQQKSFDQIYDLIAIRVIVDTIPDCYTVLGIVHTLWNQVPGRFKDYISVPKANMYQSLHTTVVGGRKIPFPFEVQIRTWEMHRVAEYGIAAHWRYKEGASEEDNLDHKLFWVRQMLDWQTETRDSREFLDTLKTDLFSEEVFLFTPKGDVISMPKGATPLDFAYRIHSAVGNQCVGARVNGKIVPLDTTLATGDRVEIMTSASSKGPGTDWLRICKTPQAKAKIRQFLKKALKEENINLGRSIIEKECSRRGVRMSDLVKPEYYEPLLRKYGFLDFEDICGAVGYGGMAAMYVVSRLLEEQKAKETPATAIRTVKDLVSGEQLLRQRRAHHGIVMTGSEDLDIPVRFAKCCSPVPGDDIVGYITRGRGVTIHKAECANAAAGEDERKIGVEWSMDSQDTFSATITILAYDRVNMLGEIATVIGENGVSIRAASIQASDKTRISTLRLTLDVHTREEMDRVIQALRNKSDVLDVYRTAT